MFRALPAHSQEAQHKQHLVLTQLLTARLIARLSIFLLFLFPLTMLILNYEEGLEEEEKHKSKKEIIVMMW
jgi:hypothetical protein